MRPLASIGSMTVAVAALSIASAAVPNAGIAVRGDAIKLAALFPGAPPGVESAVLVGDVTKPGIYVLRNTWPANTTLRPHTHGDKWRVYTVLEGEIQLGFGPKIDLATTQRLGPGSVFTGPVTLPHYFITGANGATLHVVAEGPFVTQYVE